MTCEKCGSKTNPGDQICMNCGAELSLNNVIVPNVDLTITMEESKDPNKKEQKKFLIYCTIGVIALILLVVIIVILWMGR